MAAESMTVSDFVAVLRDAHNDTVRSQGRVIDEITEDQEKYYGLDLDDFPEPFADGRVLVLLSSP